MPARVELGVDMALSLMIRIRVAKVLLEGAINCSFFVTRATNARRRLRCTSLLLADFVAKVVDGFRAQ
jgi:hypothetical protein